MAVPSLDPDPFHIGIAAFGWLPPCGNPSKLQTHGVNRGGTLIYIKNILKMEEFQMTTKKQTLRALLLSTLSLVLCLSMLVGSTFAWFTDTATVGVNQIQAGTLNIELVDPESGESMEGETLGWVSKDDDVIRWEPGCTFVSEAVRLVNKSDLSIEFMVEVGGIKGDEKLLEVIDFKIVQKDDIVENDPWSSPAFGETTSVLYSWSHGTLVNGYEDGMELTDLVVIAHMDEGAGNDYQGLTLDSVGITVKAKQTVDEFDSYTNEYDANAVYPVTEAADLEAALADPTVTEIIIGGGNFDSTVNVPSGKTLSSENGTFIPDDDYSSAVDVQSGANIILNGGTFMSSGQQIINSQHQDSTVVINGGTYKGACLIWNGGSSEVIVNGGEFDLWCITVIDASTPCQLTINGGNFTLSNTQTDGFTADTRAPLVINGGTFNQNPSAWVGEGHTVVDNGNGTWTVE